MPMPDSCGSNPFILFAQQKHLMRLSAVIGGGQELSSTKS